MRTVTYEPGSERSGRMISGSVRERVIQAEEQQLQRPCGTIPLGEART